MTRAGGQDGDPQELSAGDLHITGRQDADAASNPQTGLTGSGQEPTSLLDNTIKYPKNLLTIVGKLGLEENHPRDEIFPVMKNEIGPATDRLPAGEAGGQAGTGDLFPPTGYIDVNWGGQTVRLPIGGRPAASGGKDLFRHLTRETLVEDPFGLRRGGQVFSEGGDPVIPVTDRIVKPGQRPGKRPPGGAA